MAANGHSYIVGAYEHPLRKAPDRSLAQLHGEVALGALADAGLSKSDIDGYFCAGDVPGTGPFSMVDYLNLKVRHVDSTNIGGSSYILHVNHAAQAIAAGKCNVALVTLAGRPRREGVPKGGLKRADSPAQPDYAWETPFGMTILNTYAMCAKRHMHEYGTTSEQLAWIKVAASHHAQHNPNAMLRTPVTVEEVMNSQLVADPLHKLDCCIVSDGGGAVIVTRPEVARSLKRPLVKIRGAAESVKHTAGGDIDLTYSAGRFSGAAAFAEAGVRPSDVKYASLYDSFTVTVLVQLEDLGFCARGKGGAFVADGKLISGQGPLAVNTDGGGLCNNHPAHRGGMTKIIEAVRQLRGEAHPAVQVRDLNLAVAHGTGGMLGTRHGSATLVLERM